MSRPRDRQDTGASHVRRCTTGEGPLVGRNRISRSLVPRFPGEAARKTCPLQSLAILHHDIESAWRENSAVSRKTDLPIRGEVATNARSENMWKVGDVEPVRVHGRGGLSIWLQRQHGRRPVVSFAYASRALAEAAANHLELTLLNAISVRPYAG